jgi:hypothetical protein
VAWKGSRSVSVYEHMYGQGRDQDQEQGQGQESRLVKGESCLADMVPTDDR